MRNEQSAINFVNIFNQRLSEETPIPDQMAREVALMCADIRVNMIRKRLPAYVFVVAPSTDTFFDKGKYGIWVESRGTLERGYAHRQLEERLKTFVKPHDLKTAEIASAYLFEDGDEQKHLVLDTETTVHEMDRLERNKDRSQKFWGNIAREYRLSSILGDAGCRDDETDEQVRFADSDIVGKLREEEHLLQFAQDRQMTNSQWLRFRLLALGARDAKVSVVYDKLADDIAF